MGSDFSFNITMVEGAGAFVCGEETASDRLDRRTGWDAEAQASFSRSEGASR